MNEPLGFDDLIQRIRSGDPDAAAQLVAEYEPFIRRATRNRMRSSSLRRMLDSMDICQSVLASLFHRTNEGQYVLNTSDELQKLLMRMVRNKVADAWRRYSVRILGIDGIELDLTCGAAAPPEDELVIKELIEKARSQFSGEELELLDLRIDGREWDEIARLKAGTPESLRKRLSRAIDRVSEQLQTAK